MLIYPTTTNRTFIPFKEDEHPYWHNIMDHVAHLKCIKGQLTGSALWLDKESEDFFKNRRCTILLAGDNENILSSLDRTFRGSSIKLKIITSAYVFKFRVNDKGADKFLDCINLIDKVAPFDKETFLRISTWAVGYAITGNIEKVGFSPLFGFLMAMHREKILPKDITKYICQLFIQSTGIVFDENKTQRFCNEFTAKELQRTKPIEKTVAERFDLVVPTIFKNTDCAIV